MRLAEGFILWHGSLSQVVDKLAYQHFIVHDFDDLWHDSDDSTASDFQNVDWPEVPRPPITARSPATIHARAHTRTHAILYPQPPAHAHTSTHRARMRRHAAQARTTPA